MGGSCVCKGRKAIINQLERETKKGIYHEGSGASHTTSGQRGGCASGDSETHMSWALLSCSSVLLLSVNPVHLLACRLPFAGTQAFPAGLGRSLGFAASGLERGPPLLLSPGSHFPRQVQPGSGAHPRPMSRRTGYWNTTVLLPPYRWLEEGVAPERGRGTACRRGPELRYDTRQMKQ